MCYCVAIVLRVSRPVAASVVTVLSALLNEVCYRLLVVSDIRLLIAVVTSTVSVKCLATYASGAFIRTS